MSLGSALRRVQRRWLTALAVVLVLFLGYLWAGYVLAPRLIRSEAMRWAHARPTVALTLGTIRVDPLHFTVTVHDVQLSAQGQPLASLQRLFVGLAPLSLLVGTYHLTALELDAPQLNLVIGATGKLNLAALSAAAPAKPENRKPTGPMPQIRIDALRIDQGQLSVTDLEHSPAAREHLAPITLRLVNFRSWGRTGGRFALQAASADGARLSWWGQITMAPLASSGALSLTDIPVISLARFLPHLPVSARGGRLGLSAQYTLSTGAHGLDVGIAQLGITTTGLALDGGSLLQGAVRIEGISAAGGTVHLGKALHASLAHLTFTHLQLQGTASAHGQDLSLQRLSLAQSSFDPHAHRITIGTLAMRGLRLPVQRGPHGRLALLNLLPHAAAAHRQSAAQPAAATANWHVQLGRLALRDAVIAVQDRSVTPAAHFALRVYSFDARRLSNNLARPVPFTVHAGIAPRGYLVLSGRVTPARTSAALWVSLSRLPLRPFVPYLPLARTAELHSGTFGTRGFAELVRGQLAHLEGRADVRHLRLIERGTGIGLFGWRALSVRGIAYRPGHLVVSDAQLTAPEGQIVILPNRTLNLAALVPPRAPAGKARPAGHPVRAGRRPPAPALAALLERLEITDGSINFADESIEPNFHAPIDNLHGTITNVSTSKQAIAHIALGGQVIDQYSPVTVSGAFNPYGLGRNTDIRAAFKNIQLPIFDPYSDRYAGYAIAQGILSARFRYRIDNRRLDADHRVEIDQLQWGGPSASKQSVGWPIRLATALLKDRNGVIRIHLPVTGSLSNPDFHIASIVWTMLVHLLEKAALAPFSLIGHLFAGAAQAQYIAFRPGSAALPHAAGASLAALSHALAARPALRVEIPAGPATAADALALENQRIEALALAHLRHAPPGRFAALPAREQRRALAALFRARLHRRPAYPAPPSGATASKSAAKPSAAAQQLTQIHREIRWLRAQLRPTVHLAPGALVTLGLARAQVVQNALLAAGTLSPKRVFITTLQSGQPWHDRVRLQLRLQ